MKLTKKQKQETVMMNKDQAQRIIFDAELANKGIYCHSINSIMSNLKVLLDKKLEYDTPDFNELCKLKLQLAGLLYMAKNLL